MRKFFIWLGIILGNLVGLILLVILGLYVSANVHLNETYAVQAETIIIPADDASIERGRLWVESGACKYCHGDHLAAGQLFWMTLHSEKSQLLTLREVEVVQAVNSRMRIGYAPSVMVLTPKANFARTATGRRDGEGPGRQPSPPVSMPRMRTRVGPRL